MCHMISLMYGLNVCVDVLNILSPNVMILGGREAHMNGISALTPRNTRALSPLPPSPSLSLSLSLCLPCLVCENALRRRWSSENLEVFLPWTWDLLAP